VRKADNLPPSCAVVMKSGNLNFLEPSGPVQAYNGNALPFIFTTLCHHGFGNLLRVSASESCSQRLPFLTSTLRSVDFNPMLSSTTCLSSFFCGLAITSYMPMQRPRKFTPTNSTSGRMMKTTKNVH